MATTDDNIGLFSLPNWSHDQVEQMFRSCSHVFPVYNSGKQVKKPKGPSGPVSTGSYGIKLDKLSLAVVDIDLHATDGYQSWDDFTSRHGITLPPTLTVETPSGGQHLYFRVHPGQTVKTYTGPGSPLPGVDLLGNDGTIHVVGPGSKLGEYNWSKISRERDVYQLSSDVAPAWLPPEIISAWTEEYRRMILRRYPMYPVLHRWYSTPPLDRILQVSQWTLQPREMIELLSAIDYLINRKQYDNARSVNPEDLLGENWWEQVQSTIDLHQLIEIFETNLNRSETAIRHDQLLPWHHLIEAEVAF